MRTGIASLAAVAALLALPPPQARADDGAHRLRLDSHLAAPGASASLAPRMALSAGWGEPSSGHSTYAKRRVKHEPESFAEPLAFTYIMAPLLLAAGIYYSEPLGFDDLSRGAQIAFGTVPFLLPPLVHLGYDDPGGALVAIGGMLYFAALGAVTGGIAGYMWEPREENMPAAWDSTPARRGALIGAGIGYALWAIIDVVALSDVPDRTKHSKKAQPRHKRYYSQPSQGQPPRDRVQVTKRSKSTPAVGASVSPVMGPMQLGGVTGAAFSVHGAW